MEAFLIMAALFWIAWELHRLVEFLKSVAEGYLEASPAGKVDPVV